MKRKTKNFLILLVTIAVLVVTNGVAFSKGFLGWSPLDTSDPLGFAGSIALLFCDIALIGYECYACFKEEDVNNTLIDTDSVEAEDYYELLEELPEDRYRKEQKELRNLIRMFDARIVQITDLLGQMFGGSEYTLTKYANTVGKIQNVFYDTVVHIMNRIKFDNISDARALETSFIRLNQINRASDKLIKELLDLNESDSNETNLLAMEDMKELIENTKLYQK